MPIPNTKLFASTALSSAGGYTLLPVALGDFSAVVTGGSIAPWIGAVADLNGDLLPDVIVGAPGDDDKAVDAGRVFIELTPGVAGTSTHVDDALLGKIVIDGISAGDATGAAIGTIASLNGDAYSDILIGAPGTDVGVNADAGAAYVVWSDAAGGGVDLNDPFNGDGKGFVMKGEAAGDAAGTAITSIADLNGDGQADILVGAPGSDAGKLDGGATYVVWGQGSDAPVDLATVATGVGGFRIIGEDKNGASGRALGSVADLNGDGKAEILIGASLAEVGGRDSGAAYVVFGKSTGTQVDLANVTAGIGGFRITGAIGENIGAAVQGIGDVDGDGKADILVGAGSGDKAYVVYGKSTGTEVLTSDLDAGIGGFSILAEQPGGLAQVSFAESVDLNRDGVKDIVIGAPTDSEGGADAGAVYIAWGGSGSGSIDLSLVSQGIGGAKVVGDAGSLFGSSVVTLPDMNGDGAADLLVGSAGAGMESVSVLYAPDTWQIDNNVYGTNGDDVMGVGDGSNKPISNGADYIHGLDGNDTIDAGAGDDTIEGGAGADVLSGGLGNDTYIVDDTFDTIVENAGEGTDTVVASVDVTLGAEVENLQLVGFGLNGTGNDLDNTITGTDGNDVLDGATGHDTLIGGFGNDTYVVDDATDVVTEQVGEGIDRIIASVDYTLVAANIEELELSGLARHATGNALNNTLIGSAGDDTLDGGAGADSLQGGLGDDTYLVDNAADHVFEVSGQGNDKIIASVDYTLSADVETLELAGAARHATGNAAANTLIGTVGDDTLDGAAGADTLKGGLGNDSYVVDNASDAVVELDGEGTDTVTSSIDYTLGAYVETLALSGAARHGTGNAQNNTLIGTGFADTLDGGAGADVLRGGAGDDTYLVDNVADDVQELALGGKDTVIASIDWTLGAEVENLTLAGAAHHGTGNALDNVLTGGVGDDTLSGLDGNDTLDGGAGIDTMIGGNGDDTYYVDSLMDVVVEDATGGNDTVVTSVDWVMSAASNVEYVRLTGTAHSLIGNELNNRMAGGTGDDTLDGGLGDDVELGGDGNDHLISGAGHDVLAGGSGDDHYEIHGGSADIEDFLGHDTIDASAATGNSSIDLSGDTATEVEGQICNIGHGGSTAMPLDVQFLQDLSGSFGDDIANVRTLVPGIVNALKAVQPNSMFGSSSFVDKPIGPFGATGEWVYRTELALTTDSAALATTYSNMVIRYGMDAPEAQIESLMQLALHSTEVGFRPDSARFVVLFTDAPFHVAGDGSAAGITTPNNGDAIMDGGGIGEDYPLVSQLKAALIAANIIPIFAIAGGVQSTYQTLVTELGRGTVVTLTANSSDVVTAVTNGLTAATVTTIEDAVGGAGDDVLKGSAADNVLTGNDGNDTLDGKGGADKLYGGAGDDKVIYDAADTEEDGGVGSDTLVITTGLTVDLSAADQVVGGGLNTGFESVDASASVVKVILSGNAEDNVLKGGSAGDALFGAGGNDTLEGGAGADSLNGGVGSDRLFGGAGGDTVFYDAADAVIDGGANTDTLMLLAGATINLASATDQSLGDTAVVTGFEFVNAASASAAVTITGDAGNNYIFGSAFNDTINGGAGNDGLSGRAGNDIINGDAGNDTIDGGLGADILNGGDGNDTVTLDALDVSADGGAGVDTLTVNTAVVIDLSAAVGQVVGGTVVVSGFENVNASGATAGVSITGDNGNNILTGSAFADTLDGGAGNDTLNGGLGADVILGGAGNDSVLFDAADTSVDGGAGTDTLLIKSGLTVDLATLPNFIGFEYVDASAATAGVTITGDNAANNLVGSGFADTLMGGAGNDVLAGNAGSDILDGGAGTDVLNGGLGVDTLLGGEGGDIITYDSSDAVVDGGLGTDTLTVRGSATIDLSVVADQTSGDAAIVTGFEWVDATSATGAVTITGTSGNNFLWGGAFSDTLNGGAGSDGLNGRAGNDTLDGGLGNDTLSGGAGVDQLTGGLGADQFVFSALTDSLVGTADTLFDFSHAEGDKISLASLDANSALAGDQAFNFIGGAAFSGVAGELRTVSDATKTSIFGDVNGDSLADFQIDVVGAPSLVNADFYL